MNPSETGLRSEANQSCSEYNQPITVFTIFHLLTKQRIRFATYFFILVIFLSVQWASPHAHLSGAHEHSGDRHHHSAEIHAHQPVTQHPDAIDSVEADHLHVAGAWVVELEHPQLPSSGQQPDLRPIVLAAEFRFPTPTLLQSFRFPENANPLPDLPPAHVGQPRAPPQLA